MHSFRVRYILLVSILCFCIQYVSAQVQFGIKAGYNLAAIPVPLSVGFTENSLSGFNAGLTVSIPLSKHFFLQPELVYSEQGKILINHDYGNYQHIKYSYKYLNLPILIKYQHTSGLFAETGPQLGILLNLKFDYGNDVQSTDRTYTQPMDFAWVFGLGYKMPKLNLGLDIRYNVGLTDIYRYGPPKSYSANNRVFQVGLLYFFKHL